jgi:glucosylceramidase
MVTINSDGTETPNEDYYGWAQFSKFVEPTATVLSTNEFGSIEDVAFQNPDGSIVVVVLNTTSLPS